MTTTITIKDKPINATYQNVTGLTGGAGVDAVFDVDHKYPTLIVLPFVICEILRFFCYCITFFERLLVM